MNKDQITGRIVAIETILNQAFSFSLTQFEAPLDVLTECEDHLAHNLAIAAQTRMPTRMAKPLGQVRQVVLEFL